MRVILITLLSLACFFGSAQTNTISTNPAAEAVMLGKYNPATYQSTSTFTKTQMVQGIWNNLSTDTMLANLYKLATFQNRNTGSDTISQTRGVGAARRWIHSRFEQYSARNQNRLLPSYLQFDQNICNIPQHRDIFSVLPGTDTSDKSVIIIEAHMDSRCEGTCDTLCLAEGMEDNGSGTVLVMELARVMSAYSYKRTIVFLVTIGEEQGLNGATAFANYCADKGVKVRALLNNDVVGGVICGKTSSPPGCPGENDIDSLGLRIFSFNTIFSAHKSLARFIKLEYKEEVAPWVPVKTDIRLMNAEDRTGRGGDHIPFRQKGFTSIRFTCANEHGDANSSSPNYTDRQHSTRDVLGKDVDNDGDIDSFYVDMPYLKRNAMVNANTAMMAAIGPANTEDSVTNDGNGIGVVIKAVPGINSYRVGVRTYSNDFDTVYTISGARTMHIYPVKKDTFYYVSTASVDADGTESIFSIERRIIPIAQPGVGQDRMKSLEFEVLPPSPDPADETTTLAVFAAPGMIGKKAWFSVTDILGKEVAYLPIMLQPGMNEVLFEHGFHTKGVFVYSFFLDGKIMKSGKMVFK